VFKKDVGAAVDILADILQNSSLDAAAVERERSVILREMEEVEKEPEEVLFDHLHATAFQFSSLGRPILGPAANVRSITRDDLASYIATHYTAPRMVLVGAGAVDHEALVKLAAGAFTSLRSDPTTAAALCAASPAVFTGSEVRMRDDDSRAVHLALGFKGAAWKDADSVPLMVMQAMLGSWDKHHAGGVNLGSPLAQRLAVNQLVSSYMAFNTNYNDCGLFGIHAVAEDAEHLDDMAWAIMKDVATLAYDVNAEDLLRAKEQLKSSLLLHVEGGSSAVAEDIGRQLLTYGRRVPRAEMFARIDAVTPDTVKAVGRRFITDQDIAIAAMGPTQFLPDYNWWQRHTYLLRY
jgi:processing peptidase subunit beta